MPPKAELAYCSMSNEEKAWKSVKIGTQNQLLSIRVTGSY